jgi:hypothetical protein
MYLQRAGNVPPAVYSFGLGMYLQRAGNVPPAVYSFVLIHLPDLILGAAFVVSAVNAGRCLRCFSGKSGSNEPIKVARYVICDDAIIAVRINTNDNDINNN